MMPDLGKYADAVLSSYAVSLLLLIFLVAVSLRRSVNVKRSLEEMESKEKADG